MAIARSLLILTALAYPLLCWGQSPIVGTWELVYVDPTSIEVSDPRGIVNTRMQFTTDGKLSASQPDDIAKSTTVEYRMEGKQLSILRPGAPPYIMAVSFPDTETMLFTPPYGSQRRLRRMPGPDVEIEPVSLELIKIGNGGPTEVSYDSGDYSRLALPDRLRGKWEVIAYQNVPRNQAPPYGFFNDVWTISRDGVVVKRREPKAADSVPLSVVNDQIASSGIALGGPAGSRIDWKVNFDKWGHLHLERPEARIVLKLVSKDPASTKSIPLKIVLLNLRGE